MRPSRAFPVLLGLLTTVLLVTDAHADSIDITLTQTTQSGAAGSTVTFEATIINLTSGTIFLNGDSSATSSPSLIVDDNPFLVNAPLSLAAGASSGPLVLFNVIIAPGSAAGLYGFNTFSILGGPDGNAFSTIGSAQFNVVVSPVPEPATLGLLASGLLVLGIKTRLRRQH